MQTEEEQSQIHQLQKVYIRTYQSAFYHAILLCSKEDSANDLFVLTYVDAYVKLKNLSNAKNQELWIQDLMDQLAISKMGLDQKKIEEVREKEKQNEQRGLAIPEFKIDETSLFLEIEERLDLDEGAGRRSFDLGNRFKNIMSAILLAVAAIALIVGVVKIKGQLDILRKPLIKPLESGQEEDFLVKEPDIWIQLGGKIVYLSDVGQVLYSIPVEETDFVFEKSENLEIQKQTGWTYYLPCPERSDTKLAEVDPSMHHTLYRMRGDGEEIEIIAREVDNYTFWEDGVYIDQYGRVQRIDINSEFEKKISGLYPSVRNNEIYLYDTLGRTLMSRPDGSILYEDRKFQMSSNRIESVQTVAQLVDEAAYYLKDGEKEIYKKVNESETVFETQGLMIDSFCIADDWIYYSAYIRKGGSGAHYSEIYRKSLKDQKKAEKIREEFTGRIYQMHYSEENNQIYGNYIPKNWKSNHGVIAVISLTGQMSILKDQEIRREVETTGNDILEFIMVQDNQVYCYWSDCYWKPGETAVALWRKVLVISNGNRDFVD